MDLKFGTWNVRGLCNAADKQKEVKKLIQEECLQFCAVLETHVEFKNIKKTCDNIFGSWEYTSNGEDNSKGTLKKLDKVMVNEVFLEKHQQAHGAFLPNLVSDHSPIIVKIPNGDREFEGHSMYRVVQKLKALKGNLKKMSWQNGNVFERVVILKEKVKECQTKVDKYPHDREVKKESVRILEEYIEAKKEEYNLLCQKAKVEWIKEGDKNTAYFHKTIKERAHRSRIMSIRNENGVRFKNKEVAKQIVKHFEEFLGTTSNVQDIIGRSDIFINKHTNDEAMEMVRPISDAEIKNAMFGIEDSKAPGPDGYTSRFYKSAWSIVGKDVCQAVKEFFTSGKLLGEVNAIVISLIPKILIPDKVSDLRPIACCNVPYKGYNKKLSVKKVAFKIDLQKAYDTISWNFLMSILGLFGFHEKMVHWIMSCVTSAKFSINVSGERIGYFKGGRGLRQGDPISLYLFTLVMEVLTLIIKKNIESAEEFKYHYGCKRLRIISLCFVDDLLVFCHGNCDSVSVIKKSLDEFSSFSGLLLNMQKSFVFFGGLSALEQQRILDIIPFNIGKLPVKYLGVPLITKKIGVKECKPLVDKIATDSICP
ncbi:RNA-directed DNA polymerase, eukaryota, reverse transcriptase zinc-binding domain protein [Tanacetum coccineum]